MVIDPPRSALTSRLAAAMALAVALAACNAPADYEHIRTGEDWPGGGTVCITDSGERYKCP